MMCPSVEDVEIEHNLVKVLLIEQGYSFVEAGCNAALAATLPQLICL